MLADEGREVVVDDAKASQVLNLLQGLTKDGTFPRTADYQGSIATFANGQAGFLFQGEWEITTFQTAKMPFSMAPFPNVYGGSNYACQADSHTLVLPRRPGADPAQLDRSLGFIRSMLDQSKTWAEGGHVPSWLPFRDSDEYKQMTPQSYYAAAADAAVYDPDGWYSGSGSGLRDRHRRRDRQCPFRTVDAGHRAAPDPHQAGQPRRDRDTDLAHPEHTRARQADESPEVDRVH